MLLGIGGWCISTSASPRRTLRFYWSLSAFSTGKNRSTWVIKTIWQRSMTKLETAHITEFLLSFSLVEVGLSLPLGIQPCTRDRRVKSNHKLPGEGEWQWQAHPVRRNGPSPTTPLTQMDRSRKRWTGSGGGRGFGEAADILEPLCWLWVWRKVERD